MDNDEFTHEEANLDYEEYENSDSEDTFEIWKVKRYIDTRIMQLILGFIGAGIGILIVSSLF